MKCILILLLFILYCIAVLHIVKKRDSLETFKSICATTAISDCNKDIIAEALNSMNERLFVLKQKTNKDANLAKYSKMYDWYLSSTMASRMKDSHPPIPPSNEMKAQIRQNKLEMAKKEAKLEQIKNSSGKSGGAAAVTDNLVAQNINASTKGKSYDELMNDWADMKKGDIIKKNYSSEMDDINNMDIDDDMIAQYKSKLIQRAKDPNIVGVSLTELKKWKRKAYEDSIRQEKRKPYGIKAKKAAITMGFALFPPQSKHSIVALQKDINTTKEAALQSDMGDQRADIPKF
jgi:hypothetical protein